MIIAVNTRVLSGDTAAAGLLVEWVKEIAAVEKGHHFYLISNHEEPDGSLPPNVKCIVIGQQSANPLLWKLWYNYKLPSLLRKINAGVLVAADGVGSLRSQLPQLLIVNDIEFLHHPEWYGRRYTSFMKQSLPASLKRSKRVITFSEAVKEQVAARFPSEAQKVNVSFYGTHKKYRPMNQEERSMVKEKYAGGNEYFLFNGAIHNRSNLVHLLKAFSLFKKRQKSSLQLILLTGKVPAKNEFVNSLRLYKYRNEIKLLEGINEEETALITAAAWCAVNLSPLCGDIFTLQNAVSCEVPAIACSNAQAKELLGGAALYADPGSVNAIADQLMTIYKDEKKQGELVENGKKLNNGKTKFDLWQHINAVVNNVSG